MCLVICDFQVLLLVFVVQPKKEKKVVLVIYDFPIFVFGVRSLLVICDVVFHVVFLVVCNFHVLLMVFVVFILLGIYDFHVSFWCSL